MKTKILSLLLVLVLVIGIAALNVMAEETTAPAAHTDHCVCGGGRNGRGDHVCGEAATGWVAFSEDLLVYHEAQGDVKAFYSLPSGNYYLASKTVITGKSITIMPGDEVTFCLNGFEMTTSSRTFRVSGTLNITDCYRNGNGKITGNSGDAPVIYGYSGGRINLYGGILTAKTGVTRNYGGVVALGTDAGVGQSTAGSTMVMYGGNIKASALTLVKKVDAETGKTSRGSGGAVILMGTAAKDDNPAKPCTFIQYGGTVNGAKSVEGSGAAIYAGAPDTVKILGVSTVTAGNAEGNGDCIYAVAGANVVVGGSAKVDDLFVLASQTFSVEGLQDGAKIGLSAFTSNQNTLAEMTEADAAYFTSNLAGRPLVWADGKLTFANHANHCVCGGNLSDIAQAAHGECVVEENWIALTNENLNDYLVTSDVDDGGNANYLMFAENGSYYLAETINIKKPIEIHNGQDITLCLNGYTWAYAKGYKLSAIRAWGNLNITDCTGAGKITSNADNSGSVLYMHDSKATADFSVNIYGGKLTSTATLVDLNGGVISVGNASAATTINATLNIFGGTITGGSAKMGGNIYMNQSDKATGRAIFNMYDGLVSDGTAVTRGGNIYINRGYFTMYGGTAVGGTLTGAELGADIGCGANTPMTLTLNGNVTIGEIGAYGNSADKFGIQLGENFSTDSVIKVSSAKLDKVIVGGDYADYKWFKAASESEQLTYENKYMYLRDAALDYHCRCGENLSEIAKDDIAHNTCNQILWTDLTQAMVDALEVKENDSVGGTMYILPAGNYKLVEDITTVNTLAVELDTTVNLDLNGHTLTGTSTAKRTVYSKGTLYISDSAYDPANPDAVWGKIVGGNNKNAGHTLYIGSKSDTRLYGGEITSAFTEASVGGPVGVSGKFHMVGGKITGLSETTKNGGAIVLNDSANVTIWGGVITGGKAALGGAIASDGEDQKITVRGDAVISGGSATQGGNIYSAGTLIVNTQAVISDGVATKEGGNIYAAKFTMVDGTISGGTSASYGGSIYIAGNSTISGGSIENGLSTSTSRSGGNICVANKATLTITGGEISGGKANEGGNISIRDGATLNIEGGKIHDGEAVKHGGNIVAYTTLNISGGEIYNGKAVSRGGNISTYGNYGKITITGGHIYDGMLCGSYTGSSGELVNPEANARYGANIAMQSTDNRPLELTILGGEIGGLGADSLEVSSVHIQSSGDEITTTVGGTAVIDSLRMGTGRMVTIHADGFAEGASIGVERFEIAGLFAPEASADYAKYFHATENGVTVQANETGLVLVSENPYWAFDVSNKQIAGAKTIAEAMAIEGAGFVRLVQDHTTTEVVTGDVYLDLYGNTLTGLTVNGTLYAADYQTNSYEDGKAGSLVNFTGDVQTAYKSDKEHFSNTMLYVAVQDETGAWSFHALSATLTHTSLDPANDALGYKVEIMGDSQALSVVEAFGMDIYVSENSIKTCTKALNAEGLFTLRLKNIMKNNGGEMTIYGAPVVVVDGFAYTFSTTNTTMKKTIQAVNDLKTLTDDQKTAVYNLYEQYESVMSAWLGEKNNIATWAPVSEEIPAA
ncbi:MAG: hypothetical protein IKW10_08940 [Oscillospiraceae bacterium]|nr:hypothetical protein [Oscillospiraceae bacterium]